MVRIYLVLIENWQDLSRSGEWPALITSLMVLFEIEPDLGWTEEWRELITLLKDSYCKQTRSELERRMTRVGNFPS